MNPNFIAKQNERGALSLQFSPHAGTHLQISLLLYDVYCRAVFLNLCETAAR